jgi:hypothetical protein
MFNSGLRQINTLFRLRLVVDQSNFLNSRLADVNQLEVYLEETLERRDLSAFS